MRPVNGSTLTSDPPYPLLLWQGSVDTAVNHLNDELKGFLLFNLQAGCGTVLTLQGASTGDVTMACYNTPR